MAGHKSIKRIIHRCAEEVDATRRIAKVTSLKEGLETFRAKVDIRIEMVTMKMKLGKNICCVNMI